MARSWAGITSSIDPVTNLHPEMGVSVGPVAVERDDGLVFGNGLVVTVLGAQHLAFGEMRERAAGRTGQGSLGQVFRARDIGRGCVGHKVKGAGSKLDRQPALRATDS